MKNKPILLIAGEPKSIFFEILFKALKKKKYKSPLILICNKKILINQMKLYNYKKKLRILDIKNIDKRKINNNYLNVLDIHFKESARKIYHNKLLRNYLNTSFNIAFKLIDNGVTNKLINGPINKTNFLNRKFLGITEYISNKFKKKNTGMLIYNKKLSVCPVTTHLPLKMVAKTITKKLISEKIDLIDNFYKKHLKIKAKIAVTGLNPHCESISRFNEDEKIIPFLIKKKMKKNINIKGPYSADTIFLKQNRKKFNIILGMYHDQVIGPFKSIFEYDAINITMGLPIMRISPDHGPNISMIGKNKSNPLSLIKALDFLDKR